MTPVMDWQLLKLELKPSGSSLSQDFSRMFVPTNTTSLQLAFATIKSYNFIWAVPYCLHVYKWAKKWAQTRRINVVSMRKSDYMSYDFTIVLQSRAFMPYDFVIVLQSRAFMPYDFAIVLQSRAFMPYDFVIVLQSRAFMSSTKSYDTQTLFSR